MRVIFAVAFLAMVMFAGCIDKEQQPAVESADSNEPQFLDTETNFTVDQPTLPRLPPAEGERGFDVPTWRLGEWWKYRMVSHFDGQIYEFMRVVAGTEHGNYLVGFPVEDFVNDVMVLHVPGYGDIQRADLSYAAHDVPYVPLNFPLEEGKTWVSNFESETNPLTFLVEEVDEVNGTAFISASGGQGSGVFTYDAEFGEISRWYSNGYADYSIMDHGYNYTGVVRVPHDHDLIFMNGRIAGVVDAGNFSLNNPAPMLPTETIEVAEGYDRASFAAILLDGVVSNGQNVSGVSPSTVPVARGYYSIKATAPDGTVYEATLGPGDGRSVNIASFGHEGPAGTWTLEAIAVGEGIALLEGIGYHSIDIDLPSGCVLASANANHHAQLCKA